MENVVPMKHLRREMPRIMARVEGGRERFTITSHGRPVAKLIPYTMPDLPLGNLASVEAAAAAARDEPEPELD